MRSFQAFLLASVIACAAAAPVGAQSASGNAVKTIDVVPKMVQQGAEDQAGFAVDLYYVDDAQSVLAVMGAQLDPTLIRCRPGQRVRAIDESQSAVVRALSPADRPTEAIPVLGPSGYRDTLIKGDGLRFWIEQVQSMQFTFYCENASRK